MRIRKYSLKKGKFWFGFIISIACLLSSCVSGKKTAYLQDIPYSDGFKIKGSKFSEPLIQPDDILSISVQTIDPQSSSVINQLATPVPAVGSSSGGTGQQVISGFLVDKDGIVELPMIGKLKLGGVSTFKAREIIREKAAIYFKNPTVVVRYANFKITVLGEVLKPGTYTMPNEKVSLLDAIGLAGDLTIYGKRDNILLVREDNGTKEFARFNLNSAELFQSPYFFLRQNDIIYIEPNKAKVATTNAARTQLYTLIASTLSFVIVFLRYRP